MSTRYRSNFLYGVASGVIANTSQTTITGTNWPTIPSGQYLPVVLNPGYYGTSNSSEVIYVTYASGTVATVVRAQEGSVATSTTSGGVTPWIAGPLVSDFGITNQMNNGDFPAPAASGQFLISSASGSSIPQWSTSIPVGAIQYDFDTNLGASSYIVDNTDVNNIIMVSGVNPVTIVLPISGTSFGQQSTFVAQTSQPITFSGVSGTNVVSVGANPAMPQLRQIYSVATASWLGGNGSTVNEWIVIGDVI